MQGASSLALLLPVVKLFAYQGSLVFVSKFAKFTYEVMS